MHLLEYVVLRGRRLDGLTAPVRDMGLGPKLWTSRSAPSLPSQSNFPSCGYDRQRLTLFLDMLWTNIGARLEYQAPVRQRRSRCLTHQTHQPAFKTGWRGMPERRDLAQGTLPGPCWPPVGSVRSLTAALSE